MTSHSSCLCLCDHTHCIDDITHTLFMTSHLLYIWHNMHCIWHRTHDLWHHNSLLMTSKLLYHTSHRLYLTAHPLYLCHHTQIIDHAIPIVCMITQPQYVWHHMNYIWHHIHSFWYHTMLWHPTHCIHVITPRIPVITSTVAGPLLIVYWLYHTYYICDIKPTICITSHEFYVTLILTLTLYDITILYSWLHIHSLHDSIPTLSDITYCTLATLQPLYLWQDTSYVYDIILNIYDIAIVHEWQYNHSIHHHTHCICVIQPTRLMISQTMYVWNLPQCM